MPWLQFAVMAFVAALFTIPAVLLIPRARTSPAFDRFLWIGTLLLAFLCAWLAIGYMGTSYPLPITLPVEIDDVPLVPIIVGAAVGALALNALLWLLDRLAPPDAEEEESVLDLEEPLDGDENSDIIEETEKTQEQK
jgi:hypothetical protein